MIKFIREYAYCVWKGAGFMIITGFGLNTWQWWLFTTVMTTLVVIRPKSYKE